MWRIIPAMVVVGLLIDYDATHALSKPARLALFTICALLALLCVFAVIRAP